jgi:hypothetical protein
MDNNFLLTYEDTRKDVVFQTFQWFETEEELRDYVKEWNTKVIEAVEIKDCKQLKFK